MVDPAQQVPQGIKRPAEQQAGQPKTVRRIITPPQPLPIIVFPRAYFSRQTNLIALLKSFINQEQKSIKIAMYWFFNEGIAAELKKAQERGVNIEVVGDNRKFYVRDLLEKDGIKTFGYNEINRLMHHKFIIFGNNRIHGPLLWTGSLNLSKTGFLNNQENVIVMNNTEIIKKYEDEFEQLKRMSRPYQKSRPLHRTVSAPVGCGTPRESPVGCGTPRESSAQQF